MGWSCSRNGRNTGSLSCVPPLLPSSLLLHPRDGLTDLVDVFLSLSDGQSPLLPCRHHRPPAPRSQTRHAAVPPARRQDRSAKYRRGRRRAEKSVLQLLVVDMIRSPLLSGSSKREYSAQVGVQLEKRQKEACRSSLRPPTPNFINPAPSPPTLAGRIAKRLQSHLGLLR